MVLKGVDEIDWFTDRPFRAEKKQRAAASKWGMKYEDYAAKSAKELSRMRAWVRRHPGKVATDYFNR